LNTRPNLGLSLAVLALASSAAAAQDATHESVLPSISARTSDERIQRSAGIPDDAALVAAGARVGKVSIDARPIFDTRRPDEDTTLFRLANRIHMRTRDRTIQTQLLFDAGDKYDPRLLAESERVLRNTRYLQDAEIVPTAYRDGIVDVEVVTKDVWTLSPGVSFGRKGGKNTNGVQIEELNLLGRGSQVAVKQNAEIDRTSTEFVYRDRQLGNSWWRVDARYSNNSDGRRADLVLDHPFYALDSRRAGGVSFVDDDRVDSRYDLGEIVGQFRVRQNAATAYVGHSRGLVNGSAWRWTGGFTWDERRFDTAPSLFPNTAPPADRKLAYPWVGIAWVEDAYRTTRNRDQIERTEDYSLGWRAQAGLGIADKAFGADRTSKVFNASIGRGIKQGEKVTWEFDAGISGRHERGEFANTVLSSSVRYYRRQSQRYLSFASLTVESGTHLDSDRQLLLGGDNGLRGYPLRYQGGESLWLLTLEQRGYSNWYPFRLFNVGAAAFFDIGGTSGSNAFGTPSQGTLKDVGFGLRLGNSRSALGNVVHVDFAYPLDAAGSNRKLQIHIETKRSF
jgi:hypothetical protein